MAARYLSEKGLRIVDRRVRCKGGELDIIARDGREWVFVEVKTRAQSRFGTAAEALSTAKVRHFARAVKDYVYRNNLDDQPIRCDFVAIDINPDESVTIEHFAGGIAL